MLACKSRFSVPCLNPTEIARAQRPPARWRRCLSRSCRLLPSGSRRWAAKRPLAANALRPRARTKTARTRFARIDRVTATNAGSRRFEWRKRARCFSFRHPVALRRSSDSPPHGHSTPPRGTPEALKKTFPSHTYAQCYPLGTGARVNFQIQVPPTRGSPKKGVQELRQPPTRRNACAKPHRSFRSPR